jgi:hypothetical protein
MVDSLLDGHLVKREAPMAALILVIGNEKTGQNGYKKKSMSTMAAGTNAQACDARFRPGRLASLHQISTSGVVVSATRTGNVHRPHPPQAGAARPEQAKQAPASPAWPPGSNPPHGAADVNRTRHAGIA